MYKVVRVFTSSLFSWLGAVCSRFMCHVTNLLWLFHFSPEYIEDQTCSLAAMVTVAWYWSFNTVLHLFNTDILCWRKKEYIRFYCLVISFKSPIMCLLSFFSQGKPVFKHLRCPYQMIYFSKLWIIEYLTWLNVTRLCLRRFSSLFNGIQFRHFFWKGQREQENGLEASVVTLPVVLFNLFPRVQNPWRMIQHDSELKPRQSNAVISPSHPFRHSRRQKWMTLLNVVRGLVSFGSLIEPDSVWSLQNDIDMKDKWGKKAWFN